jgi:hypothetical protein
MRGFSDLSKTRPSFFVVDGMYEGCSESNAPHIFSRKKMYEIHAQCNWMLPLDILFFHIIYVYGLTPA